MEIMIDYKDLKTCCALCDEFMIMKLEDDKWDLKCTEYNAEFSITKRVKKCSRFSLRYNLKEDMMKKDIKEINNYFGLKPENVFIK